MNPLKELSRLGQSPWYDNISRRLLDSGELGRLIREDGMRGLTSNPTIFERAISGGSEYDAAIRVLVGRGEREPRTIFEELAVEDLRRAADLLLPVYETSGGADGFVSLEVSPLLARDTAGTVAEARRLFKRLGRPNAMIKVPATLEGLPAIETLVAEGISVNVTLIFSIARYEAAARAYISGLKERAKAGGPLGAVASVASFFVSRIDAAVDKLLEERLSRKPQPAEAGRLSALKGRAAVANARLAYARFLRLFSSPGFRALKKKGALAQRVLWASTGTKNPAYSDVLYVEELVGPETVNTMPPETWRAFRDHGRPRVVLSSAGHGLPAGGGGRLGVGAGGDPAGSRRVFAGLKKAGVDFEAVTASLEEQGIRAFADSFRSLLGSIEAKAGSLAGPASPPPPPLPEDRFPAALRRLEEARAAERLWAKDASLWKDDPAHRAVIRDSLGWLRLPETMARRLPELEAFAEEVRAAGLSHVLLLGMGGSSLAPEVFRRTFGSREGFPELLMLDSTDPEAVLEAGRRCDPRKTLYLAASKSGTTTEPLRLLDYFEALAEASLGAEAGRHFAAITDPGTPLERLARERGFRRTFLNPPDVGGRYSALSCFGLVPAALMGIDLAALLDRARALMRSCGETRAAANPGLRLAAELWALAEAGRDKLTFILPPGLAGLGLWLEQLLAESLGKEGRGLVPVCGEPVLEPSGYGKDRCFLRVVLEGSEDPASGRLVRGLEALGHPVVHVRVPDRLELGAEFCRWEVATAALGLLAGVNPFDQPNVQQAKDLTKRLLERRALDGALSEPERHLVEGPISLSFSRSAWDALRREAGGLGAPSALARFLALARPGDYAALLAYLSPLGAYERELQRLRAELLRATGAAVQSGYGPRYLHSTGQLHKGGPDTGLFLMLLREDLPELPIPSAGYGFGELLAAQGLGDFQALEEAGRRAVCVRFRGGPKAAVRTLREWLSRGPKPSLAPR